MGGRQKTGKTGVSRNNSKQATFAAIDIGTTKISCFLGRREQGRSGMQLPIRVIGIGHHPSNGLRAGAVVDMELAERSIRAAVEAAERMAGVTARQVAVNLSAGALMSENLSVDVAINGYEISDGDLTHVLEEGRAEFCQSDRQLIHGVPVGYSIDGNRGIRDPRGMFGESLGVDMLMVTAAPGPIRNLTTCVERCHLDVSHLVVSPYASGLACLVEDELDLGVTCIDMGGGTTSVAVFAEGQVQFMGVVPIGGNHVTSDIARGLTTSLQYAERMKTFYGSALGGPNDDKEMIRVPQVGEDESDEGISVPKSALNKIIRPRLEEIFEFTRDMLGLSGLESMTGRRVVLTGGASQLNGARELGGRILGKQVRLGQPIKLTGLAEATRGPAFSTCAGLLSYFAEPPAEAFGLGSSMSPPISLGGLGKMKQWFRQSL